MLKPLLRTYGPWGSGAHVSYPYSRLVNDGVWHLPDRGQLLDAKGNVLQGIARERDAPAGFAPEVLAAFEAEPELKEEARRSGVWKSRPQAKGTRLEPFGTVRTFRFGRLQ